MKGFCYAAALQFRLDIRSKALFITCYLVFCFFMPYLNRLFAALERRDFKRLLAVMFAVGFVLFRMAVRKAEAA